MQKSKLKRFIASILLMITMISSTTPIFAASGSGKYVGGQYDSGMYTTDNQGSKVGILIRKLINNRTGEKHTVFCAEHGIDFKTGVVYNGQYYTPTNSAMRKACKIATTESRLIFLPSTAKTIGVRSRKPTFTLNEE